MKANKNDAEFKKRGLKFYFSLTQILIYLDTHLLIYSFTHLLNYLSTQILYALTAGN